MSTASDAISSQLSQTSMPTMDINACTVYTLRFMFWFSVFLLTLSSLSSMLSQSVVNKIEQEQMYDTLGYRHPVMLHKRRRSCGIENFGNVEYLSYSNKNTFNVQSIPLTAPIRETTHEIANLTFGQVNRHIIIEPKQQKIIFNIHANLYVLDGNVYDQATDKLSQSYKVHLLDDNNNHIILGELKKDGDGIYKLVVQSKDINILKDYKYIQIVYNKGSDSQVMLTGKFK